MTYKLDDVKILVVEDMLPMLTLTKSILQIFGFRKITAARSGEEGYAAYLKEKPDIIITDWLMDEMDGLELIKKVRTDPNSHDPYIPIVLMTGYSDRPRVEKARDNGMTEFLTKPYASRDLYNRIVQLVEKPRQFVDSEEFFGPDRRRREENYKGSLRRKEEVKKDPKKPSETDEDDIIIMREKPND